MPDNALRIWSRPGVAGILERVRNGRVEGGNVVLIKKTETLKPNQRGNRGDDRERG
jgi:hypothetical protein